MYRIIRPLPNLVATHLLPCADDTNPAPSPQLESSTSNSRNTLKSSEMKPKRGGKGRSGDCDGAAVANALRRDFKAAAMRRQDMNKIADNLEKKARNVETKMWPRHVIWEFFPLVISPIQPLPSPPRRRRALVRFISVSPMKKDGRGCGKRGGKLKFVRCTWCMFSGNSYAVRSFH